MQEGLVDSEFSPKENCCIILATKTLPYKGMKKRTRKTMTSKEKDKDRLCSIFFKHEKLTGCFIKLKIFFKSFHYSRKKTCHNDLILNDLNFNLIIK